MLARQQGLRALVRGVGWVTLTALVALMALVASRPEPPSPPPQPTPSSGEVTQKALELRLDDLESQIGSQ